MPRNFAKRNEHERNKTGDVPTYKKNPKPE